MTYLEVIALLLVPMTGLVLGFGAIRYAKWADRRAH